MNDNKNKKKKGSPAVFFIVAMIAMIMANVENSDAVPAIIIVGAVAVFIAVIGVFSKKAKQTAARKTSDRMDAYTPAERKYSVSTPIKSSVKEDCDYGADNCEYSHDEARRVKQLNEFLKNGTIDKAEYKTLLDRYRREAQAAEYHKS